MIFKLLFVPVKEPSGLVDDMIRSYFWSLLQNTPEGSMRILPKSLKKLLLLFGDRHPKVPRECHDAEKEP